MATKTLKITSPVGTFTRKTATNYTHAVVWNSPRAADTLARSEAGEDLSYGVNARWIKDRGYATTWHSSERTARAAAASPYKWDCKATPVGVFQVEAA